MQAMMAQDTSMAEDAKRMQRVRSDLALSSPSRVSPRSGLTNWGVEDMASAIRDIADMSEKTMIRFIILGDLARAIRDHDGNYVGEKVQIGFPASHLTPEIKSLFKTWKFEETKYGYKYFYTPPIKWDIAIPVEIYIFKKHYKFFENPDLGWYRVDDFLIPNPFEKYWKARYLICPKSS